jgi:hypothetical protein
MKPNTPSSMFDTYTTVWKTCTTLWPLFLVQFLFLILQYVTLFLCLALLFGPFVTRNMEKISYGFSHPEGYDWSPVLSDWVSLASDPTWIAIALGLVLLYITWWCLLSAMSDGGVYRSFWDYFEKGQLFDWGIFFKAAFHWMIPMLWLQFFLSLWFLGVFTVWLLLVGVAIGLLALTGFSTAAIVIVALLLGVPSLLLWVVFGMGFTVFSFLSKAHLTKGMKAPEAIREAFRKFKANNWQVGLGLVVAFLIYVGISVFLRMGLQILSMIPVLGVLFSLLDMAVGIGLIVLMMVCLSGLSVAYLQDEAVA